VDHKIQGIERLDGKTARRAREFENQQRARKEISEVELQGDLSKKG